MFSCGQFFILEEPQIERLTWLMCGDSFRVPLVLVVSLVLMELLVARWVKVFLPSAEPLSPFLDDFSWDLIRLHLFDRVPPVSAEPLAQWVLRVPLVSPEALVLLAPLDPR